ncbi:MAG: restriction endonuclease subunit S [Cellulosilyticum sp.]|nr:restriction endonuclease subunit S [Cellulosilyticum sp.]
MFGDPAFNTKGWDEVELATLLRAKPSNGFFAKNNEYCENGNAKVMWLSDVINRMYSNTEGLKQVNVSEKELDKYRVRYGDLLFCRSSLNREGIGKATAIPPNIDDCTMFECHVIRAPLSLEKCIPEFIQIQTTLDYFRNQVFSKSKTATMTTIGQEGIVSTKVINPPLEKQKEFVRFIAQVDKLKFEVEQSL